MSFQVLLCEFKFIAGLAPLIFEFFRSCGYLNGRCVRYWGTNFRTWTLIKDGLGNGLRFGGLSLDLLLFSGLDHLSFCWHVGDFGRNLDWCKKNWTFWLVHRLRHLWGWWCLWLTCNLGNLISRENVTFDTSVSNDVELMVQDGKRTIFYDLLDDSNPNLCLPEEELAANR